MWTFLVQINTSVTGKSIYDKSKHNDSETKQDLCFDHPSYPPASCCLIGEELASSYLWRTGRPYRLLFAVLCKMLGGLHFIKDAVGELYEFVCIWGTGDKIIGRLGFLGFMTIRSNIVRGHKSMDLLCVMFWSSHTTLLNVEMKGSPKQVIWVCTMILSWQCMWGRVALLIDRLGCVVNQHSTTVLTQESAVAQGLLLEHIWKK